MFLHAEAFGYQVPRREAFRQLCGPAAAALLVVTTSGEPAKAVLSSKGCYQGQGEACAELAGENSLIKSLQEKSSANREKNEKVR